MGEVTSYTKEGIEALIATELAEFEGGLSEEDVQTLIDTANAALVDGAPGLLNTLNEIAAAISDDEDFAVTMATELGTKATIAALTTETTLRKSLTAVNIEDHGAVANSTGAAGNGTDNTAAILAAIAEAATRKCPIFIPWRPLGFRFTAQLHISHLFGGIVGGGWLVADYATNEPKIMADGLQQQYRDFRITGTGTAFTSAGHLMQAWGAVGLVVDNVRFENADCMALVLWAGTNKAKVTNNYVNDCWADGIHVGSGCGEVLVKGNHIFDTGDDGIGVTGDGGVLCNDVEVCNNFIRRTGSRGIAVIGAFFISVHHNDIRDTWLTGISISGEAGFGINAGIQITYNCVSNAGQYQPAWARGTGIACGIDVKVTAAQTSGRIEIIGNSLDAPRNNYIRVGDNTDSARCYDLTIQDNLCFAMNAAVAGGLGAAASGGGSSNSPTSYAGIMIAGVNRYDCTGNKVFTAHRQGIHVLLSTGISVMVRNRVNDANIANAGATPAIDIDSGTPVVTDNIIEDPNTRLTGTAPLKSIDTTGSTNPVLANNVGPDLGAYTIQKNNQTDSYSLVLADAGKVIELNKATALNLTVPLNSTQAFPIDTVIELWQQGAGQVTVVATGGVTIRSSDGKLKLYGQYAGASLRKRGTDEWVLVGDLVA